MTFSCWHRNTVSNVRSCLFSSIRYSAPEMTWYENKELLWVRYKKSGDHWPRNEPSSPLLTETWSAERNWRLRQVYRWERFRILFYVSLGQAKADHGEIQFFFFHVFLGQAEADLGATAVKIKEDAASLNVREAQLKQQEERLRREQEEFERKRIGFEEERDRIGKLGLEVQKRSREIEELCAVSFRFRFLFSRTVVNPFFPVPTYDDIQQQTCTCTLIN